MKRIISIFLIISIVGFFVVAPIQAAYQPTLPGYYITPRVVLDHFSLFAYSIFLPQLFALMFLSGGGMFYHEGLPIVALEEDLSQLYIPWPVVGTKFLWWNVLSTKLGTSILGPYLAVYLNMYGEPVLEIKITGYWLSRISLGGGGGGGDDDDDDDECDFICIYSASDEEEEPFLSNFIELSCARMLGIVTLSDNRINQHRITLADLDQLSEALERYSVLCPKYLPVYERAQEGIDEIRAFIDENY